MPLGGILPGRTDLDLMAPLREEPGQPFRRPFGDPVQPVLVPGKDAVEREIIAEVREAHGNP